MTEECLCKINLQGEVLSCQDGFRPSSEMKMHLKVYEKRPDVRAVVHAHPPYATTFAIGGQALNRAIISESIVSLGCVLRVQQNAGLGAIRLRDESLSLFLFSPPMNQVPIRLTFPRLPFP